MTDFASPRGKLVTFAKMMANKKLGKLVHCSDTELAKYQHGGDTEGKESLMMSCKSLLPVLCCLIVFYNVLNFMKHKM